MMVECPYLRPNSETRIAWGRHVKSLGILMVICLAGFTVSLLLLLPQMMMVVAVAIVLTGLSVGSILPALFIIKK